MKLIPNIYYDTFINEYVTKKEPDAPTHRYCEVLYHNWSKTEVDEVWEVKELQEPSQSFARQIQITYNYYGWKNSPDYVNDLRKSVERSNLVTLVCLKYISLPEVLYNQIYDKLVVSQSVNDINANTHTFKFSGVIDVNTDIEIAGLTQEEVTGIKKFLKALDNATCSYVKYITTNS